MRLNPLVSSVVAFLAISPHAYAADTVVVQSTSLKGWEGCDSKQEQAIRDAWEEAMTMAKYVKGKIDWSGSAEIDFLGSPRYNKGGQDDIKKVLENAQTFQQGWRINPRKWTMNVRCDDWLKDPELGGRCKRLKGAAAYTNNVNKDIGVDNPRINFCPRFFGLQTCAAAIQKNGKKKNDDERLHMQNYQCRGYALLHELFHIDSLSNVGKQGHITDLYVAFWQDSFYTERMAYGPETTKILANWANTKVGEYVSRNADNLAQYTLAKWVGSKIGKYPYLPGIGYTSPIKKPFLTFVDGKLSVKDTAAFDEAIKGPFVSQASELEKLCSDADGPGDCSSPPIKIDKFVDSPPTPQGVDPDLQGVYVPSEADDHFPANPFLHCTKSPTDSDSQASAAADIIKTNIKAYCSKVASTSLSADDKGVSLYTYPVPNTPNTIIGLSAALNYGDPACKEAKKIDENECNAQLAVTVDSCDTDTSSNKYGGVIVSDCIAWSVGIDTGDNSSPPPSSDPAKPDGNPGGDGKFAPGWCGIHVVQYQKNEDDGKHSHSPEYVIDVSIFDGAKKALQLDDCNGCGTTSSTVALNGAPNVFKSALPKAVIVVVGATDGDAVKFEYGDQKWGSDDEPHHSNFGPFEDGKREGDTGFSC